MIARVLDATPDLEPWRTLIHDAWLAEWPDTAWHDYALLLTLRQRLGDQEIDVLPATLDSFVEVVRRTLAPSVATIEPEHALALLGLAVGAVS